nr:MAG TPA: hypothetical protein [Caudoviricetes sp.]
MKKEGWWFDEQFYKSDRVVCLSRSRKSGNGIEKYWY